MTAAREIVVRADNDEVAADGAARLLAALATAQRARGTASVVLTGGGIGVAMLRAVAASARRDDVDWSALDVFWGDERFVPAGSEDRNDAQARRALLDHVDLDPARVHPMAPSDATDATDATVGTVASGATDRGPRAAGGDPDAGAEAYARVLADAAARFDHPGSVPAFDVLLAGCGPEGHTLSVFPGSPAVHAGGPGVVAVRDCPKPPPTRISLTLATSRFAREAWLVATGAGKAEVLGRAAGGAGEVEVPLAGLGGRERTLWLLDEAAAAQLP